MFDDEPIDDDAWYTRYFETDDYEEFNLEILGPERSAEQVGRFVRWLDLHPPQRVLDLCCGPGRHTRDLARRGFEAIGLELSPFQLEKSSQRPPAPRRAPKDNDPPALEPTFIRGDARSIPLRSASVNAVLCVFNSFGYFSDEGNFALMQEVGRVLVPGGKLMLDVLNRDSFLYHQPERTWDHVRSGLVLQEIEYLVHTSQLKTEWIYVRKDGKTERITTLNRLYSAHELIGVCDRAGLDVIDISDGEVRGYFNWRNSHSLAVIARRREE